MKGDIKVDSWGFPMPNQEQLISGIMPVICTLFSPAFSFVGHLMQLCCLWLPAEHMGLGSGSAAGAGAGAGAGTGGGRGGLGKQGGVEHVDDDRDRLFNFIITSDGGAKVYGACLQVYEEPETTGPDEEFDSFYDRCVPCPVSASVV
jgi:hypothetical protein